MEEAQQQPLRASFPPAGAKWPLNASGGEGGNSFGQDSGYTSYHSTTPNNTFNLSTRHGASATLATIDEANEGDCSMNDSGGSCALGPIGSNILTPKTAASIDQISNFHLTTPESVPMRPNRRLRRGPFDFGDCTGGGAVGSAESSFLAPCTPERLPLSRSVSFESSDTPLRTGNRSNQQIQLTPHKPKSGHSMKRKLSSNRGKLYSEGDTVPEEASDENRNENDLNDSLDCKRLDISPIPKVKRHKLNEQICNVMRSSTPKTASSQPRTLSVENIDSEAPGNRNLAPARKLPLRKFQSFSPSKMVTNRQKSSFRSRQEDARGSSLGKRLVGRSGDVPMMRNGAPLELTPTKRIDVLPIAGYVTPSKEQRVLVELNPQAPMNLAGLINGPILEDPTTQQLPPADAQLEHAVITVPTCEDFSITPAKVNLNDPELSSWDDSSLSFPSDDCVARRASNFSYGPTLNSIIEEESPTRALLGGIGAKLCRTPPSSCKSSSGRIPKRLGRNSSVSSGGSLKSPLPKGARVPASPKAQRKPNASLQPNYYPGMYCGREHLNVLKRLYEKNQDSLHVLLDYLTDEDLVQVVKVSENWKRIIRDLKPPKHWQRLLKFQALQKEDKENYRARSSLSVLLQVKPGEPSPGLLIEGHRSGSCDGTKAAELVNLTPLVERLPGAALPDESSVVKRQPFKICNSRDTSIIGNCSSLYTSFGSEGCGNVTMPERRRRASATTIHSPPVSPSKIKFVANQKVASLLKPSEQIRSCPRCGKPSRVIFATSSKNGQNKTRARGAVVAARLEKSYTLPDPDTNNEFNGSKQNTLHLAGFGEASRNNNDYSANVSGHQPTNDSPDRVRKNLFKDCVNGSSSSNSSRGQLIRSASVTKPTAETTPLGGTGTRDNNPRKLRSGTKSVDYVTVPSSVPVSGANSVGALQSKCDYAICSSCEFHFCIKCRCQFHPDTVCLDLAPNSPSKEEERGQRNVACSRQSRRSLQRLCKRS